MNAFAEIVARIRSGRLHPVQDWMAFVAGVAVLLLASIVSNMLLYSSVTHGGVIGGTASAITQAETKQASLADVGTLFSARAAEQEKYKSGAYTFIDPSL